MLQFLPQRALVPAMEAKLRKLQQSYEESVEKGKALEAEMKITEVGRSLATRCILYSLGKHPTLTENTFPHTNEERQCYAVSQTICQGFKLHARGGGRILCL